MVFFFIIRIFTDDLTVLAALREDAEVQKQRVKSFCMALDWAAEDRQKATGGNTESSETEYSI